MKAWPYLLLCLFTMRVHAHEKEFLPRGDCPQQLSNKSYTLCYHPDHRLALWALHELRPQDLRGTSRRTNDYRPDNRVYEPVDDRDYAGSGYDRGHLVPAADRKTSRAVMSETFFMSNMTPQHPSFNRGIWQKLERKVRTLVSQRGRAIVITAPHLYKGLREFTKGISLPDQHYKIIYWPQTHDVYAFLMKNSAPHSKLLKDFQVSVDELEELTGLDFFSSLEDSIEDEVEKKIMALP